MDNNGILLMTDTGNKRITAFTQDGSALLSFGSYGLQAGEFDEPVGLAYDAENNILYVADTWNQRIQAFIGTGVPGEYVALRQWDVNAWYGQDLENKPYLTIAPDGRILVADPIYAVIYVYDPDGTYVATLQDVNSGLGMVSGLVVSNDGLLYVSDGKNNVIHVYTYPTLVKSPSITSTPIETVETPQE
jgi:sugar lactone lactonase YvrE